MAALLAVSILSCFILTPLYIVYKPPKLIIDYLVHRYPDVLWRVPSRTKKAVALTIDDAPSQHTAEILGILQANGAHATFFAIGSNVTGREDCLLELVRTGNELGNHAMYDEPSRSLSDGTLAEQIESVQQKIHEAYDTAGVERPPNYFRPGSGFFSSRMRALLTKLEFRLVLGSVYPHDPQIPFWRINAAHILSMVRPGAIIVCHDGRKWTAPMLKKILPVLKNRGYQMGTVTELLREAKA